MRTALITVFVFACCICAFANELALTTKLRALGAPLPAKLSTPASISECESGVDISAVRRTANTVWLRLRCRGVTVAKPFFASLIYTDVSSAETAEQRLSQRLTSHRAPVAMRAGTHVRLSMRSPGANPWVIRTRAIALENGRIGQIIRARVEGKIHNCRVRSATELEEQL